MLKFVCFIRWSRNKVVIRVFILLVSFWLFLISYLFRDYYGNGKWIFISKISYVELLKELEVFLCY